MKIPSIALLPAECRVKGRKRYIIVDTQGFLLAVVVSEASMPERLGALALLPELAGRLPDERSNLGRPRLPRVKICSGG